MSARRSKHTKWKRKSESADDGKHSVLLVGGPFDRVMIRISETTPRIAVGHDVENQHVYGRVDDPDSGEYLGAYAWIDPDAPADG